MKTDNELIAEFMGVQVYQTWQEMDAVPIDKLTIWSLSKDLQYERNWYHLMPVIEKIAKTPCVYQPGGEMDPEDTYYPRTFGMIKDDQFLVRINRHQLFAGDTLIEAAYLSVVDFVKQYKK